MQSKWNKLFGDFEKMLQETLQKIIPLDREKMMRKTLRVEKDKLVLLVRGITDPSR